MSQAPNERLIVLEQVAALLHEPHAMEVWALTEYVFTGQMPDAPSGARPAPTTLTPEDILARTFDNEPHRMEVLAREKHWLSTEGDSPTLIATEAFHPTRAADLEEGMLTAEYRILTDAAPAGDGQVSFNAQDRASGEIGDVLLNADDEVQTVCAYHTSMMRGVAYP